MLDALALASGAPIGTVRRAVMLAGATGPVAAALMTEGPAALARSASWSGGRCVRCWPRRRRTSLLRWPRSAPAVAVCLDTKLDGIRIQAHKQDGAGPAVHAQPRRRHPPAAGVAALVAGLPAKTLILDGEVIALGADGRPRPFQETASRTATEGLEGVARRGAADGVLLRLPGRRR